MSDARAPSPHSRNIDPPDSPLSPSEMCSQQSAPESVTVAATVGYVPSGDADEATLPRTPSSNLPAVPGYEVLNILGRGGMGIVYKARQLKANRLVALKMLLTGSYADDEQLARFRSEAEAIARLQHPHIVQVFEVGEHEGQPFFSLEYCDGGSLSQQLHGTPLPPRQAASLVVVLAEAIHVAHQNGIIHRDLKPANVLLASGVASAPRERDSTRGADATPLAECLLKITDFGLAKKVEDVGQTASGMVMGTPSYMAPEQASGASNRVGPAADIYALGALLYELLTGRPPFRAAALVDTLLQVLHDEPVPPRQLQPKMPHDVETICLKCLHKDASRRYATAAELAADLGRFLRNEPIAARSVGSIERAAKWVRRRPASASLLAVAAALPLIALLLVGWYLDRQQEFTRDLQAERNKAVEQRDIAESRGEEAKQQTIEANTQKELAQDAYRKSQMRLTQMHVARGVRLMEDGDSFRALPWLAAALQEEPDPQRRANHQFLLAALVRHSPRLLHVFPHPTSVAHAEFSPDGRQVVTESGNAVRVWDLADGKTVFTLKHSRMVRVACYSPDGRWLLTSSGDHTARLWKAKDGTPFAVLKHDGAVFFAAFSPDSRQVVTASDDKTARLWQLTENGAEIGPILAHRGQVRRAAFSPDGRKVVTASNTARIWDTATGAPLVPPLAHNDIVFQGEFSPDGKQIVTTSRDSFVRVWDAASGRLLFPISKYEGNTRTASFSSDGARIIFFPIRISIVAIYDVRLRSNKIIDTHGAVYNAAFSPDGRRVITCGENQAACLWDAASGEAAAPPLPHAGTVNHAAFSPDGRLVVTSSTDGTARIWDLAAGMRSAVYKVPANSRFVVSPDSRLLVSLPTHKYGSIRGVLTGDKSVRVWEVQTGKRVCLPLRHPDAVTHAAFRSDSRCLLTACDDGQARFWDVASGKQIHPPLCHDKGLLCAVWSPDDRRVITGCADNRAHVWDVAAGKELYAPLLHKGAVYDARFSRDGHRFVTISTDKKAQLWDAESGRPISPPLQATRTRDTWSLSESGLALSPDGRRMVTAISDRTAQLWDAATGRPIGDPLRHSGALSSLSFRPDGQSVLTTAYDHRAILWDAATGKQVLPALRHKGLLWGGVFSSDGRRIATTFLDQKQVRLWDAADALPLAPSFGSSIGTFECVLSHSEHRLITALPYVGIVRVWDFPQQERSAEDWVRLAQVLSGTSLDANGALVSVRGAELSDLWTELRRKYPADFASSPSAAVDWHRRMAEVAENGKDWSRALVQWSHALRWHPKDAALYLCRGRVYLSLEQPENALADAAAAIDVDDKNPATWISRATFFASLRQWQKVVDDCSQALSLDPSHSRARRGRGYAFAEMEQWTKAAEDFARFGELSSDETVSFRDRALVALADRRTEEFQKLCGEAIDKLGARATHQDVLDLGRACLLGSLPPNGFAPLLPILERQAANDAADYNCRLILGSLYFRGGRYETAAARLQEAIDIRVRKKIAVKPTDWLFLAMSHKRLGHEEEAEKWLAKADVAVRAALPEISTSWQDRLELQMLLREARGMDKDARAEIDYAARARGHFSKRQWKEAIADYDEALLIHPRSASLYQDRGRAYFEIKNYPKAIDDLTHAIQFDPKAALAYLRRADCHAEQSHYEQAIADCEASLKIPGSHLHHAHFVLGCLAKRDDCAKAIAEFTEAIRLGPQSSHPYWHRGQCHAQQGRYEEAAADFAKAIENKLDDPWLWSPYAVTLARLGDDAGYRRASAEFFRRWGKSKDAAVRRQTAWVCCLQADALSDLAPLVDFAARLAAESPPNATAVRIHAAALYRAGKYDAAKDQLHASIKLRKTAGETSDWLLLALVHHRLGHAEEAKKWFAKADDVLRKTPPKDWQELLALQSLHREAKALLNEKPK